MVSRLFFILATFSAALALAAPATHPVTPEEDKRQLEFSSYSESSKLPVIAAQTPSDILRFSVAEDMLIMNLVPPPSAQGEYHVTLPAPHVVATIREFASAGGGPERPAVRHGFSFILRDFSASGPAYSWITASTIAGRTQLVREYEGAGYAGQIELIQDPPPGPDNMGDAPDPVRLNLSRSSDPSDGKELRLTLSAPTFSALRRKYPHEFDQYLRPILHDLGQEQAVLAPDAASAWQVLSADWKPDDGLVAQIKSIVQQTNAEAFADRRAASQSLHKLGQPAALVLMRLDRTGWTAEQTSAIDTFLTPFLPLKNEDVQRLSNDPIFLLNVQYSDDVDLRSLAAARLAKLLNKPLAFDPKSPSVERLPAVERQRAVLAPTSMPS